MFKCSVCGAELSFCLHRFYTEAGLKSHGVDCYLHGPQKVRFPDKKDSVMKFTNISKQLEVSYSIVFDFECYSQQVHTVFPAEDRSSTSTTVHFKPSSYCIVVLGPGGKFFMDPIVYSGDNVVENFLDKLQEIEEQILTISRHKEPMVMTPADEAAFQAAVDCGICGKPLGDDPENPSVRDHTHLDGKFRSAAHSKCNLNYKEPGFILVYVHNNRGFDSDIICQGVKRLKGTRLCCIGQNLKKYISFSLGSLRFVDSLQFLPASLDSLVANLAKDGPTSFKCLQQAKFGGANFTPEQIQLLLRKGIFPYEFLDSPAKRLMTSLPSQAAFFSQLTGESISDSDYAHAQKVWKTFNIVNMRQYEELYVLTDTLLLADVFQNFRRMCMEYYSLDALHFVTSPGLAWEAALRYSGVELELLTDIDHHLFVERCTRGGVSVISQRYSKANNTYMEDYDASASSKHLIYWDLNNMYGFTMSQSLPVGNFKWFQNPDQFKIEDYPDEGPVGFFIEVDLEYPAELHDTHNQLPLASESMVVNQVMLSDYSSELLTATGLKHVPNCVKLVPNLHDKEKYVLHFANLRFYIAQGMIVTKVHMILQFDQQPWLKSYIDFNTSKRSQAKSAFEKDFFKLMNNAVFGKSMENVRKHTSIELVNDPRRFTKVLAKASFRRARVFHEDFVAVECRHTCVLLNKPIYVGAAILDKSKIQIYNFHYNHILPKYGFKAQICFSDTDSLMYQIETRDVYRDMEQDKHLFDMSEYPVEHFLHSTVNKKVLGKMKDECASTAITEFVGLRPKCYSIKTLVNTKITAKGVSKAAQKRSLTHNHYKKCLVEKLKIFARMARITNQNHELYVVQINKLSLRATDDKRYVLPDGIHTLAHGHYAIPLLESGDVPWSDYCFTEFKM